MPYQDFFIQNHSQDELHLSAKRAETFGQKVLVIPYPNVSPRTDLATPLS